LSRRLDFIFFDAGGGHRAAASALKAMAERQGRPWQIRLVNFQEVLDEIDLLKRYTGRRIQDFYNLMLRNNWTLGMSALLVLFHRIVRLYHPEQVRLLEAFWRSSPPELVVSLIPHFNRAMFEALKRVDPAIPFVTILTDLADYPPHFWIERQAQYVICGTSRAAEQAREIGLAPEQIYQVSGMILRPQFFEPRSADRAAERRRLGLEPDRATALVLFGGEGSAAMLEIARRLARVRRPLQAIFLCGRNETLARRLRQAPLGYPFWVEGFTVEVPFFMQLADFFIGKPGPGSISEALEMDLPVIVERNAWTMPQERYNAEWVRENGFGLVVPSFRQLTPAVEQLLEPANFDRYRAAARQVSNRAVFEIPGILEEILAKGPPPVQL
jgi:1,2-diacylglycerol 3-beta-galactosyltransferase